MIRYRCDGCGRDLAADGHDHFVVKIEAFAAAGRLEFIEDDLAKDASAEIRRLIDRAARMSADEIEDGVYRAFRFDLCPACHRRYLANPLSGLREARD